MKIVFISNYMTHHQLPFCKQLYKEFGNDFCFVATIPIEQERSDMGFADLNKEFDFIIRMYDGTEEKGRVDALIEEADVVILGNAPRNLIKNRLKNNKLTFRGVERIYKQKYQAWKFPVRIIKHYWDYSRHKSFHLLCAGAYTAGDYARTGAFLNRAYRWGYFPEVKRYEDVDQLIADKEPASILWAGRFLEWKYPDHVIRLAQRLKEAGYSFKLRLIGIGELEEQLHQMVKKWQLEGFVEFLGSMKPEEVREYMEKSQVYLFTSGRGEGWGAVLNESMNSGCAVVASSCAGATPFLVQPGENGLTYGNNSEDQLFMAVCTLLDNPSICKTMGKKAYETMADTWNAEVATQRFLELCDAMLRGERNPVLFESGPCSKAKIIKD